jgi:hypothetical protein
MATLVFLKILCFFLADKFIACRLETVNDYHCAIQS